MPYPETLKSHPRCIFFTDFDGTITLKDSEWFQAFQDTVLMSYTGNDWLVLYLSHDPRRPY